MFEHPKVDLAQPEVVPSLPKTPENKESLEHPPHLDAIALMKEKNCYFVHIFQTTNTLDVSENNKSVDTNKLTISDKLDILKYTNPTLSTSTLRPNAQDGTFQGGFGILFSQGEVVSASPSDDGTIATSLTERAIIGGSKNKEEDIARAIDRPSRGFDKSYNEVVLKSPEFFGGFMKLDGLDDKISYEDEVTDYGAGGGEVVRKVGVLDMQNEYFPSFGGRKQELKRGFDKNFSTLLELQKRGPVFVMDSTNQMLGVSHIDEHARKVYFSLTPTTPQDIASAGEDRRRDFKYDISLLQVRKQNKEGALTRVKEKLEAKGIALL